MLTPDSRLPTHFIKSWLPGIIRPIPCEVTGNVGYSIGVFKVMLDAIDGRRPALTIYGTDYDTPDGTCIRDYVHVCDLVDAHVLGLRWLEAGKANRVFNLGSGKGFSVREVVANSRAVTNREVPFDEGARRPGDAARLVSGSVRAETELGWAPARSDLKTMIADAWRWHQTGHYSE